MNTILKTFGIGLCCIFVSCIPVAINDEMKPDEVIILSGEEIRTLLTDNSAIYEDGARQFFAANGSTLYHTPGRPTTRGTWRVADNQYCSRWGISTRPLPETCYTMEKQGERITWNMEYPAKIVTGDIFNL